jgi:hypothetical protein
MYGLTSYLSYYSVVKVLPSPLPGARRPFHVLARRATPTKTYLPAGYPEIWFTGYPGRQIARMSKITTRNFVIHAGRTEIRDLPAFHLSLGTA